MHRSTPRFATQHRRSPRLSALPRAALALVAGLAATLASAQDFAPVKDRPATPPGTGIESLRAPDMLDPTNAALRHYRAWTMTATNNLTDFQELWDKESELKKDWKPSEKLTSAVSALSDYINLALLASHVRDADWGVEYSDGFMALLPHLGMLRREARVLEAAARIELSKPAPDRAYAAELLAANLRIARHPVQDRTLISTLVAGAIAKNSSTVITALLDEGKLSKPEAATLLVAAKSLGSEDPFNLSGALRGELWLAASAFAKTGPDAGKQAAKVAHDLTSMNADDKANRELAATIEKMDEKALREDVLKHRAFFDAAQQILRDRPADAATRLEALESRIGAGEFGITLKLTAPSVVTAYRNDAKSRAALADLITKLEALK